MYSPSLASASPASCTWNLTRRRSTNMGEKSLTYGPGPFRKPDSALRRLMGVRMQVDVGGCPRDAGFRGILLDACGSESDDVGVKIGVHGDVASDLGGSRAP